MLRSAKRRWRVGGVGGVGGTVVGHEEVGAGKARGVVLQLAAPAGGLAMCDLLTHQRQQVLAVVDDVVEDVETPDRHDAGAGINLVDDGRGDGLVAAHECGRGSPGPPGRADDA